MIKLFIADISGLDPAAHIAEVTEYRRDKIARLSDISAKRRSLGAELLLNIAIPGHPAYRIADGGKPYFDGNYPFFSLSHSGDYALCAISDSEIGADIEAPRQNSIKLAKRFFTETESNSVSRAINPDEEFCRLWVVKESYIKATGQGLFCPFSSFESGEEIGEYRTWHTRLCGYHIAVCTNGDIGEIKINTLAL